MSSNSKVVPLNKGGPGPGNETALHERFRTLATERLEALLGHMLDQADDALFDHAEKAGSNQEQQMYFEAMRELRRARKALSEQFRDRLLAAYKGAALRREPGSDPDGPEDLSLVEDERLEEELAIDGMASKACTQHRQALDALCQRLNRDAGREYATVEVNPVAPQRICGALEEAAGELDMAIQPRLILYKLFDRFVMSELGGLYKELNQLFIDAGVLPTIRPQAPRKGEQRRQSPSASGMGPSAEAGADAHPGGMGSGISGREAEEAFAVLQNLLASHRGPGEWSGTGYTRGEPAPVQDVLQALSGLQLQAPQPLGATDGNGLVTVAPDQLKDQVRHQLVGSGSTARDLGQAEDDTIDLVSMVFDAVLEDVNLPDRIKALLARLQIPVLKVALLDRAFFSQQRHPARQLINEIAAAGVGWTDRGDGDQDPLFETITRIVNRVLEEFSDDVTVFDSAREELEAFLDQERARSGQIEARTRQAAEGKARVDTAREQVDAAIRERVGGRQLPDCAHRLLHEGWSQVLFITLLREGEDSDAWRQKLEVVDRLIWSLDPKPDYASRKQLVSEIPPLLKDLRADLDAVMFNPVEMTKLFKALEQEHIQTLSRQPARGAAPAADSAPDAEAGDGEEAAAEDEATDVVADGDDPLEAYRDQLDQVAIGTWFEFRDSGDDPLRAKLSARLDGGNRLIFVNRAGFKLADRRRDELADGLRQETVLMLDDNMLFDKALENVVASLRSMREAR